MYLGICFFMRVLSSINASFSVPVKINSRYLALDTIITVLGVISDGELKYEETRFLRFLAFPTYMILSALSLKRYTPGSIGRSFLISLFAMVSRFCSEGIIMIFIIIYIDVLINVRLNDKYYMILVILPSILIVICQ